jgi:ankyrin repeat protein
MRKESKEKLNEERARTNKCEIDLSKEKQNVTKLEQVNWEGNYSLQLKEELGEERRKIVDLMKELVKQNELRTRETKQRQNGEKELDEVKKFAKVLEVNCKGDPLQKAAGRCQLDVVKTLTEHGNQVLSGLAARKTALFSALDADCDAVVEWFLQDNDLLDVRGSNDATVLHIAAYRSQLNTVKIILDRGVSVFSRDINRSTPLHYAADQPNLDVVKLLVSRGADIRAVDKWNRTPREYANIRGQGHIAAWLASIQ